MYPVNPLETCSRIVIRLKGAVIVFVVAEENPPASADGHVEYLVFL